MRLQATRSAARRDRRGRVELQERQPVDDRHQVAGTVGIEQLRTDRNPASLLASELTHIPTLADLVLSRENRRMSAYTEVFGHEPDLQKMMKGDPVLHLQKLLDNHCYGPEQDGYFGEITERCLNQFKAGNYLMEDGLVDQTVWTILNTPPRMIVRLYGSLSRQGNFLHWRQQRGMPAIPAWTVMQPVLASTPTSPTSPPRSTSRRPSVSRSRRSRSRSTSVGRSTANWRRVLGPDTVNSTTT